CSRRRVELGPHVIERVDLGFRGAGCLALLGARVALRHWSSPHPNEPYPPHLVCTSGTAPSQSPRTPRSARYPLLRGQHSTLAGVGLGSAARDFSDSHRRKLSTRHRLGLCNTNKTTLSGFPSRSHLGWKEACENVLENGLDLNV